MSDEQKYTIQGLDEYIRQGEPQQRERSEAWKVAIGLQQVDPKCKNCTLEEVAVLRIVQKSPSATQKEIAAEIGKSERTVKSITIALQEKNILQRVNGKRNGYWSFIED